FFCTRRSPLSTPFPYTTLFRSLRENPLRIAEEIAMLDVVSGGRVVSGFVRGISAEYFSTGANPTQSRERFYEAAELILRAWTEEDRKSTRLNSSHDQISYAVFC